MGKPYRATVDQAATAAVPFDAKAGDVAYFEHRAPAGWELVEQELVKGLHEVEAVALDGAQAVAELVGAAHRPPLNAPKADWQAHVAALGAPAETIEGKTTKELQAHAEELEAAAEAAKKAAEGGDGGAE